MNFLINIFYIDKSTIQATSSDYVVVSTYTAAEWGQNRHKVELLFIPSFYETFCIFLLNKFNQKNSVGHLILIVWFLWVQTLTS